MIVFLLSMIGVIMIFLIAADSMRLTGKLQRRIAEIEMLRSDEDVV